MKKQKLLSGKQAVSMTLAAAMVLGLAPAGIKANAEEEKVTFTIAAGKHALSKCDDFNDKLIFQLAEEATGVHIDWITVEDGAGEKVNAMLTADLPDAFLGLIGETQLAMNMDLFQDLSGLLEEHAPHVVADYNAMTNNGLDVLTWPDGTIRSLMTGMETSHQNDTEAIQYINKEWLDQLGLEVPTTTDELYEVLCAFRDNDMNGNGDTTDEIPLELCMGNWAGHVLNFANAWGLASQGDDLGYYYKIVDGTVTPTADSDEYRAYLEFMHKLIEEGLMDKECFTETNDQYYAKLKSGVVGCYSGWTPYSNFADEEAAKWVPMRVLQADESITPVKTGRRDKLFTNRTGFVITTECENVEKLLEWWDWLSSSTENKYIMRYGEKGGYWDFNENGEPIQVTPEGLTEDFTNENYKQTYGMNDTCAMCRKDEEIVVTQEDSYTTWFRLEMADYVWDQLAADENYMPYRFVDPSQIDERSFMETELGHLLGNFRANSIMDGVTDESWEAYKSQLEDLQYYDWIQWYQDYYDGTL